MTYTVIIGVTLADVTSGGETTGILETIEQRAPLKRNITLDDIGKSALYLASDLSSGTTGEVLFVDCGYNIMGV